MTRGSQALVSHSPVGPFKPFQKRSTLPVDMMTLDGTPWVEDGVPYMVFCHEWIQIKDGAIEFIRLKDDLSDTVGEPIYLSMVAMPYGVKNPLVTIVTLPMDHIFTRANPVNCL